MTPKSPRMRNDVAIAAATARERRRRWFIVLACYAARAAKLG